MSAFDPKRTLDDDNRRAASRRPLQLFVRTGGCSCADRLRLREPHIDHRLKREESMLPAFNSRLSKLLVLSGGHGYDKGCHQN
jgi:hypothetical protein